MNRQKLQQETDLCIMKFYKENTKGGSFTDVQNGLFWVFLMEHYDFFLGLVKMRHEAKMVCIMRPKFTFFRRLKSFVFTLYEEGDPVPVAEKEYLC